MEFEFKTCPSAMKWVGRLLRIFPFFLLITIALPVKPVPSVAAAELIGTAVAAEGDQSAVASPAGAFPSGIPKSASAPQFYIDSIGGDIKAYLARRVILSGTGPLVKIEGWAFDAEAKEAAAGVWVEIDGTAYPADYGYERRSVVDHFHNEAVARSGFSCEVPISSLVPGSHSLSLLVLSKNKDKFYQSEKAIIITGNEPATASSPESVTAGIAKSSSSTKFFIDAINDDLKAYEAGKAEITGSEPFVTIRGWAIDDKASKAAGGVWVEIDGKAYAAGYGSDRRSVADHFHNDAFLLSGFSCEIPVSALTPGPHSLSFKILSHDKKYYYQVPEKVLAIEKK